MATQMIDRDKARVLIPVEEIPEIEKGLRKSSVALSLMKRLPNIGTDMASQPVLSMLPIADFVNGDAGLKITTSAAWDKVMIYVGEIAAIVPVPLAVLDDSKYPIWEQVRPLLIEAFGRVIDRALLSERNPKAPANWPDPIIEQAIAKNNIITVGDGVDVIEDISNLYGMLEDNEYEVNGLAAQRRLKTTLRNVRDANNNPIYQGPREGFPATVYDVRTEFVSKGTWDASKALAIAGDWNYAAYTIRQDMTFQMFYDGVISDEDGKVVYNLLQQDMAAMRAVMRLGWAVSNPIDIDRDGSEFPFAVLQGTGITPTPGWAAPVADENVGRPYQMTLAELEAIDNVEDLIRYAYQQGVEVGKATTVEGVLKKIKDAEAYKQ